MSDGNNILVNGDFEATGADEATGAVDHGSWFTAEAIDGWQATEGLIEIQDTPARSGSTPVDESGVLSSGSVLELDSYDYQSGCWYANGREADSTVTQTFDLEEASSFSFGFSYAATCSAKTSDFSVTLTDSEGNIVLFQEFSAKEDNLEVAWQRFEAELDLDAGSYTLSFSSSQYEDRDTVGALVDNVSLVDTAPVAEDDCFTLDLGETEVLDVNAVMGTETENVTVLDEDFSGTHYLKHLETVASSDMAAWKGAAFSNACSDGVLLFEPVDVSELETGSLSFTIESDGRNRSGFEAADSRYGDSIRIEVSIDGGEFVLLDLFEVRPEDLGLRADLQTFVGSQTGQTFGADKTGLSYELPEGASSVQLRFITNLSAYDEIIKFDDVLIEGERTVETGYESGLLANDTDGNGEPLEIVSVEGVDLFDYVNEEVTVFEENFDEARKKLEKLDTVEDSDLKGKNGVAVATKRSDGELEFEEVDIDGLSNETFSFSLNADLLGCQKFESYGWARDFVEVQARFDDGSYQTIDIFDVEWRGGEQVFVGRNSGQEVPVADGFVDLSYDLSALAGDASTAQIKLIAEVTAHGEIFEVDDVSLAGTFTQRTGDGIATLTLESGAEVTIKSDGSFSYNANGQFAHLAEGEETTDTFSYTVQDASGNTDTATVTIKLVGTNEDPIIGLADDTGAVTEIADGVAGENATELSDSGTIAFTDVDLIDTHTVSVTTLSATDSLNGNVPARGTLTALVSDVSTGDGSGEITWTFKVQDSAIDDLAAGQSITQIYTVTIDDGQGGAASQDVTVTLTGTNDAPVVAVSDVTGDVTEDVSSPDLTDSGTIAFTDVDLADSHSIDPVVTASAGALGTLTASVTTQTNAAGLGGEITWDYSVSNAAVQYLAEGETRTETFTITLDDGNGGLVDRTIEVTVTGTNDDPVVATTNLTGAVTEDASSPDLTDSGTIAFTDVDLADSHSIDPVVTASAGALGTLTASVTTQTDAAGLGGEITWDYSVSNAAVQYLAEGETRTETFTITLNDGNGGLVDRTIEVTITGSNDDPVIATTDLIGAVTEDASSPDLTDSGTIAFTDVDLSDSHSIDPVVTASAGALGTLTASVTTQTDAAGLGGEITWDYSVSNAAVQYLAEGETRRETFTITLNDGNGGLVDRTIEVKVTGTNDDPVVATTDLTGEVTEDASSPDLTDSGTIAFTDVDLADSHSIDPVVTASAGALGTLTASVTTQTDASGLGGEITWDYSVSNAAVQYLAEGETKTETFTITLDDGNGGLVDRMIEVTVTGTNDDPVINNVTSYVSGSVIEDSAPVLTDTGTINFSDADTLDTQTTTHSLVSVSGDKGSITDAQALAFLGLSGLATSSVSQAGSVDWTFSADNALFDHLSCDEELVFTYELAVSDADGADTIQVEVTVTGTNDLPQVSGSVDGGTTNEDEAPVTLDLLTNSSDAEGDNLSVTNVSASSSDGRTVTVQSVDDVAGTITIDPNQFNDLAAGEIATVTVNYDVQEEDRGYDGADGARALTNAGTFYISDSDNGQMLVVERGVGGINTFEQALASVGVKNGTAMLVDENGGANNMAVSARVVEDGVVSIADGATIDLVGFSGTTTNSGSVPPAWVSFLGDFSGLSLRVEIPQEDQSCGDSTHVYTFNNVTQVSAQVTLDGMTLEVTPETVSASATLVVEGRNDDPVADAESVSTDEDTSVTVDVLDGDTDVDGDELSIDSFTQGSNGSVVLDDKGTSDTSDDELVYTPDADFNGSDSFTYTVSDGNGGTDTETVNVTVSAINDDPVADAESVLTDEDTSVSVDVLDGDTDVDGDELSIDSFTQGSNGSVVLDDKGTSDTSDDELVYTPDADFNGVDSFTYAVSDGNGGSDTETVTVEVSAVNDPPVVSAIDAGSVSEDDAPETIDLLAGQSDPENDTLSAENITVEDDLGNSVAYTDNGDGTITIDPDQFGDDLNTGDDRELTISYDVSDGTNSTSNTATLIVEGVDDNAAPEAVDDNLSPGAESTANQIATGAQVAPDITYLGNGKFVATWEATASTIDGSDSAIQARVFNADGTPATDEFTVNVTTNDDQDTPAIAAVGTDQFAIVWKDQNGSTDTVQLRVFDDTGTPQTGEINVSGSATGSINNPSIDTILDGSGNERLAISWDELDPGSDPYIDVRAVVVTTTGTIVGAERVVNTQTSRNQYEPELSSLDNGNYVVTWWDALNPPDGTSFNVKARILDANNNPVSGEFVLTSNSAGWQTDPSVTLLDNGNVLFAWRDYNANSVEARVFTSTGSATAPQFTLNETSAGTEEAVQVQGLVGGGFVAVWQSSDSSLDGSSRAVMARLFDDAGAPLGPEFVVNDLTESTQQTPRVDANPDGGFTVVFSTFDPAADGDSSAVGLVRFDSTGQKISPVTTDENTIVSIQISDLLANDFDADGDAIEVTSVSGVSAKGAIVTLNGDGTISYDPTNSSALDDMANGDLETDTFTYTISDGNGGTDTATVTVTVAGVDDPPVQTNTASAQSGFTDEAFSYTLPADLFTDHDEGGAITYAVTLDDGSPLPSFMSYDPATRTVSYDANAPTLSDVGLYTLRVTATEEDGQSASTTLSLTILDGDLIEGTSGNDYLTGTIQGDLVRGLEGHDTLIGLPGADVLDGGDGNDNLQGEAGNDVLLGGEGNDTLNGGDGADLMDGGAGNDRIYGDTEYGATGFDTMLGGDGDDQIYTVGYYASDIVDAGAGDDIVQLYVRGNSTFVSNPEITLGAGADTLQLSYTIANAYSYAIVTDFNVNEDNFDISYLVDNQISGWNGSDNPFGSAGYLRVLQDGADTLFQVDLNGGADNFQTLVVFQNTNATSFNDVNFTPPYPPDGSVPAGITLDGTSGNDTLNGTIGTDTINGLGGNDNIYGGEADDILDGGDDRDNLYGEAGNDTLIGGDGDDNLNGGDGADTMDGGDGNDRFYADFESNTPGFDTMTGGAGNDTFYYVGYYASDIVDAGTGDDTVQLRLAGHSGDVSNPTIALGTGADTIEVSYSYPNASAFAIVTDFSITDDRIDLGNYINNQITGWNGSDNPFGSAGFLRLVQDGANTLLQVDNNGGANSFQTLLVLENTIAADFTAANFDPAYPPDGTIPAGITVVGTAAGERIDGTIGADNLSGEGGNDQLYGGGSGDTLSGGTGNDNLYGDGGEDTLLGGDDRDYLDGGDGADYMDGGDGDDTLVADTDYNTPGFDTMIGGAGNDSFRNVGRYANDIVDAGSGNDTVYLSLAGNSADTALPTITLGSGADTIDLGSSVNPSADAYVTVTDFNVAEDYVNIDYYVNHRLSGWDGASNPFGAGFMRLVQDGTSSLLQLDTNGGGDAYITAIVFENTDVATFTDANFIVDAATMQGYSPDGSGVNGQVTVGGASGESLNGTFGDDVISGNGGADTINGANGNDVLSGGADADVINGGFGQDRIEGGLGADTLSGGDGNDTFVFNLGDGNDTITDFETTGLAQDVLEFSSAVFANEAAVLAAASDDGLGNVLISVGADTITLENVNTTDLSVDDFNIV